MTSFIIMERIAVSVLLLAIFAALVKWMEYVSRRRVTRVKPEVAGFVAGAKPDESTLLYFWSDGCAQCGPQERQIAQAKEILERSGRSLNVVKLNALEESSIASELHVMTVPTTVLLDAQGNISAWNPGLTHKEKLIQQLKPEGVEG